MEEPADIRRISSHDKMKNLMMNIKRIRVNKIVTSGLDSLSSNDWKSALADFSEAHDIFDELQDMESKSQMLTFMGMCMFALGDFDGAKSSLKTSIEIKGQLALLEGKATDLMGLGEVLIKLGDMEGARQAFQESHDIFVSLNVEKGVKKAEKCLERAGCQPGPQ